MTINIKMIGFEILINDSPICCAGINTGAGVLTSIINWIKRKDDPTDTIEIIVGGLNSENKNHLNWLKQDLNIGDVVTIKIIENNNFDPPISTREPEPMDIVLKGKLKYFYKLREELKDHIN